MTRRNRSVHPLAAVLVASAALVLAGCTALPDLAQPSTGGERPRPVTRTEAPPAPITPIGPAGAWYDPAYAAGIGAGIELPGVLCGVWQGDPVSTAVDDATGKAAIVVLDASTGAEKKRIADVQCSDASVTDATVLATGKPSGFDVPLVDVDLATGTTTALGTVTQLAAAPIGQVDGARLVLTHDLDATVRALDGARTLWQAELGTGSAWQCLLLDADVIGCVAHMGGVAFVDAHDGTLLHRDYTSTAPGAYILMSDGYIVRDFAATADAVTGYGRDGDPVPLAEPLRFAPETGPGNAQGVVYPLGATVTQVDRDATPLGVARDGTVVAVNGDAGQRYRFVPSGASLSNVGSALLASVASDGRSALMLDITVGTWEIRGLDGETLQKLSMDRGTVLMRVRSGYIAAVFTDHDVFFPPAG